MTQAYIVCGIPGSGKSTYGRKLAEQEGAVLLDIDTASERIVKLALKLAGQDPDDRDSRYFKEHFRYPIYEQLFDTARDNLLLKSVVIVGPFTREIRDVEWPERLSLHLGAPVEVHYVSCPPEIRKTRMIKRANPRDQAKLRDWDNYLSYYEDEAPPACDHILVDNSGEHPTHIKKVLPASQEGPKSYST